MADYPGFFLTLEGGEGAGKSTLVQELKGLLRTDIDIVQTREPGGSELGAMLRTALLHGEIDINGRSELLLFLADRAEHVQKVIMPALERGALVICDRFSESTMAYQGFGRGMPLLELQPLLEFAAFGLQSDLVALLDVPVAVGHQRIAGRGKKDRIESLGDEFHERVRAGFLRLAADSPDRFCVLSSLDTPQVMAATLAGVLPERYIL